MYADLSPAGAVFLQKSKNTKSGSEMQRDKEALAELMRQKQKKGTCIQTEILSPSDTQAVVLSLYPSPADEKRAAADKK